MPDPSVMSGIVCGSSECPTCGRQTEALIGPCAECCESFDRTGRFLRRLSGDAGTHDATSGQVGP